MNFSRPAFSTQVMKTLWLPLALILTVSLSSAQEYTPVQRACLVVRAQLKKNGMSTNAYNCSATHGTLRGYPRMIFIVSLINMDGKVVALYAVDATTYIYLEADPKDMTKCRYYPAPCS